MSLLLRIVQTEDSTSGLESLARTAGLWLAVALAAALAYVVARRVIVRVLQALVERTRTKWDDVLIEHRVLLHLSHVAPALVVHAAAPVLFPDADQARYADLLQRLASVWVVLAAGRAASAFLEALVTLGRRSEGARDKPIRSYVQVGKILLWLAVGILVVATLMQKSPWALLTGLGAMTAILLLVFKDSILGFVASIQIASNDLVRVGDWVEMSAYGADGDVIDIGLHVVKVQNWDKTVSSIPTPAFLNDGFKNWRGMTESGGRRIKRSIAVDVSTVRHLDDDDLERLGRVQLLRAYLDERGEEIAAWNAEREVDQESPVNGRRLTNLGTFRRYVEEYLREHPAVREDMTFLVRQLPPGPEGVPIELYVFSGEQRWVQYEGIVADVFDHLLAVLPEFGLRAYQRPSGADLAGLRD